MVLQEVPPCAVPVLSTIMMQLPVGDLPEEVRVLEGMSNICFSGLALSMPQASGLRTSMCGLYLEICDESYPNPVSKYLLGT